MALSKRARSYLASLERRAAVPTRDVEAAIVRAGYEPFPAWLAYHDAYAGYVEPLGRESAVLGLVHGASHWLAAGEAEVDLWDDGALVITCADVHPSFAYTLFSDGHFWSSGGAGECATYDVKVEQSGAFVEKTRDGRDWKRIVRPMVDNPSGLTRLREALGAARVDEASDVYNETWVARDAMWLEGADEKRALDLWAPGETHEALLRILEAR